MKKEEKEPLAILMAIEALKVLESFSSKVYKCPAGIKTIGYGHTIKKEEDFTSITEAKAEILLKKDLEDLYTQMRPLINDDVYKRLRHEQISALLSFVYNIGISVFKKSTLLNKLNNSGNLLLVAEEFNKWIYIKGVKSLGLMRRRDAEKELFLSGIKK